MSRKKTTTIRVKVPTKHELLMEELMRSYPGLEAVPSHTVLAALARDPVIATGISVARGEALVVPAALTQFELRRAAVTSDPSVALVVRAANPGAWSDVDRLYDESREALATSRARAVFLANRGDRALRAALESGARALAAEERTLVTAVMDEALRSIGCRTTVAEGDGASGIWAERGHQLAAVLIEDGGKVELDVAGFEGDGCIPFHEDIERAVAAHGGTFEGVEVVHHGDADGGVLIRSAARAAGPRGDMARGIVKQATPQSRSRFSGSRSGQRTARTATRAGS
jgi:hypothetical protein